MAETNNDKKRRPLKALPPDGFQPKLLLIWLAIGLALGGLLWFSPGRMKAPQELTVHEVLMKAREHKVEEMTMRPDPSSGGRSTFQVSGVFTGDGGKFHAAGTMPDTMITELQELGIKEEPDVNIWTSRFITAAILLGLPLFIYFAFIRQLKAAGKGALSFGKSRAKMMTRDREKFTFADVAGCDEAKEEISEVVEFLKDPKKFTKMGGRIPKGMLLVGPPGTGKTLLAKAVAGEAEVPFFSVSGSDFVEMFVGVGASRVRDMFEQGRKSAPCIIFIDEIDAVGRQRGAGMGGGHDEREQTLNSLLVEMDGFDTSEGVIIMAATNRADVLDGALLRPGRFDRQVNVDLPDIIGREQILRVHAKKISLAEDVSLSVVARGTPGLSGADLANLLNESALLAARRNKKKVEMIDVDDAREKVLFGRERRRVMDDGEKRLVAWHEAGHAIVQAVLDDGTVPVHKVTIIPRGQSLGSTTYIPTKDILTRGMKKFLDQIAMAMGGRIAEELVTGDLSNGAYGDIKHATKIARAMVCDYGMSPLGPVAMADNSDTIFLGRDITRSQHVSEETARKIDAEVSRIITEQYARAKEIITERRDALDKIAAALIENETLEGRHVLEILQHGEIRSPIVTVIPPARSGDGKGAAPSKPAVKSAPEPLGGTPSPMPA
ncbi:MAG: ATP-dependent zinc metalloprotease FtsH [Verrucomicrobiota bacterium]